MKLLLDENLSRRIVPQLQAVFPGTSHVALLGLERSLDVTIWEYARTNDFVIVTHDADFEELSILRGAPPYVVRLVGGNLLKSAVLSLLAAHAEEIRTSIEIEGMACVEIVKSSR